MESITFILIDVECNLNSLRESPTNPQTHILHSFTATKSEK